MSSSPARSTRLVRSFHRRTPTSGESPPADFTSGSWARSRSRTVARFAPIFRAGTQQASRFLDQVSTFSKVSPQHTRDKDPRLETVSPYIQRDNIAPFWGWNGRFAATGALDPLLYRALCHSDYSKHGGISRHQGTFVAAAAFLLLLLSKKEFLREREGVRKR